MGARIGLLLGLALAGCHRPAVDAAAAKLEPWQPIDPGFKGCEGG